MPLKTNWWRRSLFSGVNFTVSTGFPSRTTWREPRTPDALSWDGSTRARSGLSCAPVAGRLFFGGDEVESFANRIGGLLPFEEGLSREAGGFDGCARAGGIDACFFDGPGDLIVTLGPNVKEGLHGAAREVAVFTVVGGEVGDE